MIIAPIFSNAFQSFLFLRNGSSIHTPSLITETNLVKHALHMRQKNTKRYMKNNNLFIFGLGNIGQLISEIIVNNMNDVSFERPNNTHDKASSIFYPGTRFNSICGTITTPITSEAPQKSLSSHHENSVNLSLGKGTLGVEQICFHNKSYVRSKLKNATHVLITIPVQQVINTNNSKHKSISTDNVSFKEYHDVLLCETNSVSTTTKATTTDPPLIDLPVCESIPKGAWVGYLSTTGVYGNHDGNWVDETSDIKIMSTNIPSSTTAFNSKAYGYLNAELGWISLAKRRGWNLRIFRCSALYGNNQSALHTALKQQTNKYLSMKTNSTSIVRKKEKQINDNNIKNENAKILSKLVEKSKERKTYSKDKNQGNQSIDAKSKESFTSRIHMVDACRAILASMAQSQQREQPNVSEESKHENNTASYSLEVYNLADDEPCPRSIVMKFSNDLLNANTNLVKKQLNEMDTLKANNNASSLSTYNQYQRMSAPTPSERTRRRGENNKRVKNSKMHQELLNPYNGLLFSSFREGLISVLAHMNSN